MKIIVTENKPTVIIESNGFKLRRDKGSVWIEEAGHGFGFLVIDDSDVIGLIAALRNYGTYMMETNALP